MSETEAIQFLLSVAHIVDQSATLRPIFALALGMSEDELRSRIHWTQDVLEET